MCSSPPLPTPANLLNSSFLTVIAANDSFDDDSLNYLMGCFGGRFLRLQGRLGSCSNGTGPQLQTTVSGFLKAT